MLADLKIPQFSQSMMEKKSRPLDSNLETRTDPPGDYKATKTSSQEHNTGRSLKQHSWLGETFLHISPQQSATLKTTVASPLVRERKRRD